MTAGESSPEGAGVDRNKEMRSGDLISMKAGGLVMVWLFQAVLLGDYAEADEDVVPNSATHVNFDFAGWCKVGDHTFTLEKTKLADIVRTLGSGTIRGNGKDAGEG